MGKDTMLIGGILLSLLLFGGLTFVFYRYVFKEDKSGKKYDKEEKMEYSMGLSLLITGLIMGSVYLVVYHKNKPDLDQFTSPQYLSKPSLDLYGNNLMDDDF